MMPEENAFLNREIERDKRWGHLTFAQVMDKLDEQHAAIDRLRTALVTVKVNVMRDGPTEAIYDFISQQLQQ